MNDQMDLFADDPKFRPWLLSGIDEGRTNEHGVVTENVLTFFEGCLSKKYVKINMARIGNYAIFEFEYFYKTYGTSHPLCRPCHSCHRNNTAQTLADSIYDVFVNSVLGHDKNFFLDERGGKKELSALCRKACDRIAKELK